MILFENEYCKIVNNYGQWFRVDKVLGNMMPVNSYFNEEGEFIANL